MIDCLLIQLKLYNNNVHQVKLLLLLSKANEIPARSVCVSQIKPLTPFVMPRNPVVNMSHECPRAHSLPIS